MRVKENYIEGGLILVLGLMIVIGSLSIANNPVKLARGWVDFCVQARFLPLLLGVLITCLGIGMVYAGKKKQKDIELSFALLFGTPVLKRMIIIISINFAYVLLIKAGVPFFILTFFYMVASIAYVSHKEVGPFKIVLTSLISTFAVGYLLPLFLNINWF